MTPLVEMRPRRAIRGMSAVLLPFTDGGAVDWAGFEAHVARTAEASLTPAVNMDTGYVNAIDEATRREVLRRTRALVGDAFVAGVFVGDEAGAPFDLDAYLRAAEPIGGATPIVFQSHGLTSLASGALIEAYATIGERVGDFLAFELGEMFAPFGRIYDLATYRALLDVPRCVGAKHSSLSRALEWERLALRDAHRPGFRVLTGNDLAIDMVVYGSDYLLGLSTFAPEAFARRDALWAAGDAAFWELNDLLQYLGFFAFRAPVPAYKHSAAMFLKRRGWIECDAPPPGALRRPGRDGPVLEDILARLEAAR